MNGETVRRLAGQWFGLTAVLGLLAVYPSNRLLCQSDPRLLTAVQLAQAGRADSARAIVRRLLAVLPPLDSLTPQALYVQGVLAADAQTAATSLQRVVVEYGTSPWADDALLRLTQLYFAQGDQVASAQATERMRRDYPDSPLKARADFLGAQAYFALKNETQGCTLVQEALAGAGDDVEFKNQVSFYAARCGAPAPIPTPTTTNTPGRPDSNAAVAPTRPPGFAVQVLAVKSAVQVDDMLTRLKVMGFDARVVRDSSGFLKVRVGRYVTREEAQRAQQRLRTKLGGQPFIVEEP